MKTSISTAVVVNDDLTQLEARTRKLRESEKLLQATQCLARVGGWEWDVEQQTMTWTEETYRLHDMTPGDLAPGSPEHIEKSASCYAPEDRAAILAAFRRCAEQGIPYDMEVPFTSVKGRAMWVRTKAEAVWRGPRIARVVGNLMDVTERQRAEEALARSQAELKAIYDHAPVMICVVDEERRVLYANPAFTTFTGVGEADLKDGRACGVFGCINALDDPRGCGFGPNCRNCEFRLAMEDTLERGTGHHNVEYHTILVRDGKRRAVSLLGSTARLETNGQRRLLLCLLDITERKQAEEELRRFKTIFDTANFGAAIADLNGLLIYINDAFATVHGYQAGELIGKSLTLLHNQEQQERVKQLLRQVLDQGSCQAQEVGHCRRDGSVFPMLMTATLVKDPTGVPQCFAATAIDLTERKAIEAQLQQAIKMESVGQLAGGVAHDFNNMLGVILGHTEMALEQVDPTQPLYADLQEIRQAAERSANLTRQLLAFARRQTISPRVLDLNETVENMLKMLRQLIGEHLELIWLPGRALWPVKIDPTQLDQLLANLCVNARDAITGSGKIIIETANTVFDAAYCARHPDALPGEYVALAVSDNGCGMDQQTLSQLFEPFFTTKEVGKGTGLGTATVYGIVKQNHGAIEVASQPGQGTTFRIYLPRSQGETGQPSQPAATPSVGNGETVLLVEDEPAILKIATMMLQRLGYTVLAAATPGEALRLAEEHPGELHLLMTDVVMPQMNGRELAGKLLSRYPDLKRLFMSGYTADVIADHGVLNDEVHFIQKPFSLTDLAATMRKMMRG